MSEPSTEGLAGSSTSVTGQPDAVASSTSGKWVEFWHRLRERKVVQWSLAYIALAYGLLHGVELVGHAFEWPIIVSRVAAVLLAFGLPVAVILAWYHGDRAQHRVSGAELTIITLLLIIGGSILWFFARTSAEHAEVPAAGSVAAESPSAALATGSTAATSPNARASSVAPGKVRLAILPFDNLSPDPANAFFTDGLHEEILSTIAQRAPTLEVVSRTTMMMYRSKPKPVAELAKDLGATHVLEGSVRREAKQVRLTLQLIDARTDRHVWSQNYDRTLANALTLQSEVAGEVASQLPVRLAEGPQRSGAPTLDPEAYDLYLRALLAERLLTPRSTLDERRDTEKLLSRAIARDPSFALAHAVRARVRLVTFVFNHDASEEQLRRAREDLDAARKRAGDDPVLLAMDAIYLGFLEQQDRQHVLRIFDAAEAAGLQLPIWKASLLVSMGRLDEAVRVYEDWMMRDPGDAQAYPGLAIALALARRPVEALRTVDRGIAQFPDFSGFARIRAQVVFCFTGQTDEWRAALDGQSRTMSSEVRFESYFDLMRFERRYPELKNMLESATSDSTRVLAGGGGLVGYPSFLAVGDRPIAEYRGWTNLLLGDHATAAEDGRAVLDFVARGKETEWNRWFLRMLEAEGHTFAGRNERAIQSARETLKLMPRSRSAVTWMSAAAVSARVYAWSGAQDEAVGLLEELMNITPGPGPAEITRDPLYALPLAQNARYQALVNRLEAQMRATKLPSVPESLAR